MICVSGSDFKDLQKAFTYCMPYETVVFLGFEVVCLPLCDGSYFYRIRSDRGYLDLFDVSSVFQTVSSLRDFSRMYQPEFDFGGIV